MCTEEGRQERFDARCPRLLGQLPTAARERLGPCGFPVAVLVTEDAFCAFCAAGTAELEKPGQWVHNNNWSHMSSK